MTTDQSDNIDILKQQLYLEAGTSNRVLSNQEEHLVRGLLAHSLQIMDQLNSDISQQLYSKAETNKYLSSNRAKHLVQRMLSNPLQTINRSNPKILHLQSLCKMEAEQIKRYQLALSPHKKVPPEVLTEIFSHCVEEGPIGQAHHLNDMPWVLLRVCSRWREVVKEAPFLTFQTIQEDYRWRTAYAIHSAFRNSKLDLQSRLWIGMCSGFVGNIIMPFASRIVRLTLTLPGDRDSSSKLFPTSPDISFASLQTLILRCAAPPPAAIFEILRRSPALVQISLLYDFRKLSITDLDNTESIMPVILPNLHSLVLTLRGGSQTLQSVFLGAFMKLIIAPSLRHISSDDMERGILIVSDTPFPCGVIGSLVSRSSCSLDSLWLDVRTHEQELNQLLGLTPSLRSLYLGDRSQLSGIILDAMADGCLLPQIEKLECRTEIPGAFDSMVNLLIKRASAGGGLKGYVESRIDAGDFLASTLIIDALDAAITEGFRIKLIKLSVDAFMMI